MTAVSRVAISTFLVVHIRLNLENLRQKYGGIRAEVGGPITVARGTSERKKKPSVTRSFNRLLLASVLSRQRSRVRAPPSPPLIPNKIESIGIDSDSIEIIDFSNFSQTPLSKPDFSSQPALWECRSFRSQRSLAVRAYQDAPRPLDAIRRVSASPSSGSENEVKFGHAPELLLSFNSAFNMLEVQRSQPGFRRLQATEKTKQNDPLLRDNPVKMLTQNIAIAHLNWPFQSPNPHSAGLQRPRVAVAPGRRTDEFEDFSFCIAQDDSPMEMPATYPVLSLAGELKPSSLEQFVTQNSLRGQSSCFA